VLDVRFREWKVPVMAWAVGASALISFFMLVALYISVPGFLRRRFKHPDGDMANEPEEE
jgi:hypothetical protein